MEDKNKESANGHEESKGDDLDGVNVDEPTKKDIEILKTRLSERGVKLKNASDKIAEFEKAKLAEEKERKEKEKEKGDKEKTEVEKLSEELKSVRKEINNFNTEKKKSELEKEFPDILPELLVGKTDEQIKAVVEKQREMNKKNYGDSKGFLKPKYESVDDIEKEIEEVKKNKNLRGDNSAIEVMRLTREKLDFND